MRYWLLLTVLLASFALQTGCGRGMAYTASERAHRREKVREIESRQLVDDWDMFWLNDRPLRTTRWPVD